MKNKSNKSKKSKKAVKRRHNRRNKKTKKNIKGGIFGALFGAINSGDKQDKPNQENISYKTVVKKGGWFSSTIYDIEYIIPKNFIAFKNPDSFFTPLFNIHIDKGMVEPYYIQIAEPNNPNRIKFIEYFISVNNEWYCMMRIYGINTGVFATMSNVVFYKLPNQWFDITTNKITIPKTAIEEIDIKKLNTLQKIAIKDSGKIIKLKDNSGYKELRDGEIYLVLRQYRNSQLFNAEAKQEATKKAVDFLVDAAV
jgi:hypothetical protein